MCPSCGFSGPFVQRQHQLTSQSDQQPPQGVPSIWIDPAVSTFLLNDQKRQVDYAPGILRPRSRHQPKKPQSISSPPARGPVTPIPPRASAQRSNNVKVRPKYLGSGAQVNQQQENDITRIPTYTPLTMWQYESSDFEIESSLPALSLLVDAPTLSESSYTPRRTDRLPYIDEIDTIPFRQEKQFTIDEINTKPFRLRPQQLDVDEIDTLPPLAGSGQNGRSLVSINQPAIMALASPDLPSTQSSLFEREKFALAQQMTDPSSWTAGSASGSPYAQRIAERSAGTRRRLFPHPMDHLRWWLLHPGRIEFILWLCGTILLLGVTIVLLLATAISLSWVSPGFQSGTISTLNSSSSSAATVVTNGSMTLSLLNTGPLVPGGALYLRGQEFSPDGNVVFTDENKHPMLREDSQTNSLMTDGQGNFSVVLKEGAWKTGRHHVIALDVVTGRALDFPVTLTAGPFGKNATATPSSSPGLTATATSPGGPGAFPTAVGSTPAPKPTVDTTSPPTPTKQPSPTPTATSGNTPTATPGTAPTTGTTPPASSSSLNGSSNFLLSSAAASIGKSADLPHPGTNPLGSWSWLLMSGYILAMFMLGFAGMIRKKHKN